MDRPAVADSPADVPARLHHRREAVGGYRPGPSGHPDDLPGATRELEALAHAGPPFFRADWGANVVGMVLDDETDWVEVAELVTDSYLVQAPRRLAFRLKAGG